jgi:hypothetical protein
MTCNAFIVTKCAIAGSVKMQKKGQDNNPAPFMSFEGRFMRMKTPGKI